MVTCQTIGGCDSLPEGVICVPIHNKVSEDVTLTQTNGVPSPCYKPFTVAKGSSSSYGVPPNSVWSVKGKSRSYDDILVLDTAPKNPLMIVNTVRDRPMLKTYKVFPFWAMIAAWVVVIILGIALMAAESKASIAKQCSDKGLDSSECDTESQLGQIKPAHKGLFTFGIIISVIALICLIVGFIFIKGPAKYSVDYDTCSKRHSFGDGSFWRWTTPNSTFRSILCKVFGGCECSSDVLNNNCIYEAAETGIPFKWDSAGAMRNSDNGVADCFCCNGKTCVVGNTTCKKKTK